MAQLDDFKKREQEQVEIKVYKQKVKHLLYEHQSNITTLKADGESSLMAQLDDFKKREQELLKDKRFLRRDLRRNDMDHEKHIRDLEFKHAAMITAMREQFDRKAKELQKEYQDKMHHLREEMDLKRKEET